MKKSLLIIISSILTQPDMTAQSKTGIENYHMLSAGKEYTWMPVVHHRGRKGVYTEMRYNYEAQRTASVYMGKSFCKKGTVRTDITPMAGFVFGKYNGGSLAMNAGMEYRSFFFSAQMQYTVNKDARENDFFFNWSELGYEPVKWLYAGVSAQFTKMNRSALTPEYGLMLGLLIKKMTIPVYVFNPLGRKKNYIIGINAAW